MEIRSIRTPGLGDATYILSHAGQGIVVDPQRDVDRFLQTARELGTEIRYVLETHVHNDYVSGGRELAGESGAQLVLPAGAGVAFDHLPAFHQEDLVGDSGLSIRPIHTPGHTPEHLSYLVLIDGKPVALFSGGSLLVGSAGRPDLLGIDRARQFAKMQFQSLERLKKLPDDVGLFPTHGEGSFCTASGAGRTTSTIGIEKEQNPALLHPTAESFIVSQLSGLQPYPAYYPYMAPINIRGPEPIPATTAPELTPTAVADLADSVHVIDTRARASFASGHLPGSIGIEMGEQFGTWAGWLLPFNADIVLVLEPGEDESEAIVQLGRIGFDRVRGILRGVTAWKNEGRPLASYATVDVAEFTDAVITGKATQVLDVRAPSEWEDSHIAGSLHRYLPDLRNGVPDELSRDVPVWVICGGGYRATMAAGLLERAGYTPIVLSQGGAPDVLSQLQETATSSTGR